MSGGARIATQLEWQLTEFQKSGSRERQALDPTSAAAAQLRDLGRGVEIIFGRVVDAVPYAGIYKVLPERGLSVITCCQLSDGPDGAVGVRSGASIPPGCHVWFLYHRDINYGMILAVEPYFMTNPKYALSDYIFVGSRSGLHRESAHGFPWRTNTRGLGDWSAGAAFDSTTAGEWYKMSRTGLRVFVDDFMAQLSAGEACGLYVYLWDQLCRLTGINLQIRSNVFEWEALDDESEHFELLGRSIYPWESLGATEKGQEGLFATHTAKETEIDQPWYGAIEPKHDDQMPVRRILDYGGYLGQGGKRLLQAPTKGAVWRYGNAEGIASLFEEQLSLTGGWSVRSAKHIIFAKRPLIPHIYPKRRPESEEGDTTENYKASSAYGSGPEHKVTGQIRNDSPYDKNMTAAAAAQDMMAYVFNWESQHPFCYHGKDWELGQESDAELGEEIPLPKFGDLAGHGRMYLPSPETASINIDHRYRSVDYALSNSYFGMLDDGSIAIGDGYGSEFLMAGGHVKLAPAADIQLLAGRNVLVWGGRDVLVRAKKHAEVAATDGDVRIKAERHLWCLAGNGGDEGMLLLESRSTLTTYDFEADGDEPKLGEKAKAGGITMRVPHSNLAALAKDILIKTGGGTVEAGDIVLDAAKGNKNIVTNSNALASYLQPTDGSGVYHAFYTRTDQGGNEIEVQHAHAFTASYVMLDSWVAVLGALAVDGKYYGNDWIYLDTGHIATAQAPDYNNLVPSIKPESFQSFFDQLKQAEEQLRQSLKQYYTDKLVGSWYDEKLAANDRVMTICEFSFRTSKQSGTLKDGRLSFRLYESRWQQMDRLGDKAASKWAETWVTSQGHKTGPFPGAEALQHGESYIEQDLTIFDLAKGISKARGSSDSVASCYADPKYGTPNPKPLHNNYPILE